VTELVHTPDEQASSEPASELFAELPSLVARGLVYLLFALLLAAGLFAGIARVSEIVSAPAVVTPQGEARPLQAAAAGRVTRVVVAEGDRVTAGQALIYLETDPAQAQLERARREREIRQRQLQGELAARADALQVAEARARLAQVEAEVVAAERARDATMIVAPLDGQVIRLTARGPGQAVQQGELLAEVAPAGAPLVVVARVANRSVGRVRVGQSARVKIDAYPHQRYGALPRRVTFVSPGAAAEGNEATTYRVTITPAAAAGERSRIPLRVGLAGTAEIVTSRPRVVEFILRALRGES
jgi:multidrug efflux pump subunit AcrA (membrane-fusion protein)